MAVTLPADSASFRFLAFGDMPYNEGDDVRFARLLERGAAEDFAFFVHVGDTKSSGTPCTDEYLTSIRELFAAQPVAVVYTPGDNEWTDSHRKGSGYRDPVERLDKIRELYFSDLRMLKLDQLGAIQQSLQEQYRKYVENYRFRQEGVVFAVLHVVGSNNNRQPNIPGAVEEFEARDAANRAFLDEAFLFARTTDAPAVCLIFHANPRWMDAVDDEKSGFTRFLESLYKNLETYRKPVLAIHGDSHYFRVDKPLRHRQGTPYVIEHFTRAEVPGARNIHGLAITVDPDDPQVFSWRYFLIPENAY